MALTQIGGDSTLIGISSVSKLTVSVLVLRALLLLELELTLITLVKFVLLVDAVGLDVVLTGEVPKTC